VRLFSVAEASKEEEGEENQPEDKPGFCSHRQPQEMQSTDDITKPKRACESPGHGALMAVAVTSRW
jgi:hypothetical protein